MLHFWQNGHLTPGIIIKKNKAPQRCVTEGLRRQEEEETGPAPARVATPWGQGHLDAADAPAGL
jgi:hypothetical protein